MHYADSLPSSEATASRRPNLGRRQIAGADLSEFEITLLAIAGHDLRQPLQVLQSTHERLGHGPRTRSEQRLLEVGQTALDQMKRQLDRLVGAVCLHERAGHLRMSPLSLAPLLQEVQRETADLAAEKGIFLRVVPSTSLVISDALLMSTILRNLIGNAIKYTRPGGRVLVGARQCGETVRIDVIDTGVGIADDKLSRIFDAFTRLDSNEADGLGIGLFIVRRASAILGHCLDVSSAPSRGTRFSILVERA